VDGALRVRGTIDTFGAMRRSTPKGLEVTDCALRDDGAAFLLAHPKGPGPIDMDTSVIFEVTSSARAIGTFPHEMTGIAVVGDALYAVDGDSDLHEYRGAWRHHAGVGSSALRINRLVETNGQLFGLTGDGVVYCWTGRAWDAETEEVEDLHIHDAAHGFDGKLWVCGHDGLVGKVEKRKIRRCTVRDIVRQAGRRAVDLTCVLPLASGELVVTGWDATVLAGASDALRAIPVPGPGDTGVNAVRWNERVLIGGATHVFEYAKGKLRSFAATPATRLIAAGDHLWKLAETGAGRFDGSRWEDVHLSVDL
jgi:hypothetical protein